MKFVIIYLVRELSTPINQNFLKDKEAQKSPRKYRHHKRNNKKKKRIKLKEDTN